MDARQAFEEVYAAHEPAVRAFVLRRLGDTGADDVVSEVFLAAWRRVDELPADSLPWLLNIARGVMSNRRRADARWQALVARMSHERGKPGSGPARDLDLGVFEVLATLSETDRELVLLVAWEGLSERRSQQCLGYPAGRSPFACIERDVASRARWKAGARTRAVRPDSHTVWRFREMSRTAMRRLRAANPIAHPSAPRPIDTVIPGWASVDRVRSDRRSGAEAVDHGRPPTRRSTSGSRLWSGLAAALGVGVTIAVVVFALVGVHATKRPARTAGTPASTHHYTDAQGWSLTYPSPLHDRPGNSRLQRLPGR